MRTHQDRPGLLRLLVILRVFVLVWAAVLLVLAWWMGRDGLLPAPWGESAVRMETVLDFGVGQSADAETTRSFAQPLPDLRAAAPDFELPLFDGRTLRLADLRGQGVVLNFWASWCPPCRTEAPIFASLSEAFRDRGVVFVGVNIQDNETDARAFLEEFKIGYPNGPDPGEIATEYGIAAIPTTIFIDAEGRIARRWIGGLTEPQLVGFLEEMLQ